MTRPIGYYVHHQGEGHLQRAMAIARCFDGDMMLLGAGLEGRVHDLPFVELTDDRLTDDFDGRDATSRPAALHYAPYDHDGIRRRVASVADWIAQAEPMLMIVDVSVEMAMLARLASVPTIYVRLNGRREDEPHRQAFEGAVALLAPFAMELDDEATAPWVQAKTFYAPGIVARPAPGVVDPMLIVGVVGRGGAVSDGALWAAAARAMPDRDWKVVGPCSAPRDCPANLQLCGWVDEPGALIAQAGIVVGAAGDGVVSSVIALRRPFICMPEDRPFDEQRSKARRLGYLGAAIICETWPDADAWPALVEQAEAINTAIMDRFDVPDGAERAAAWIADMALRQEIRS